MKTGLYVKLHTLQNKMVGHNVLLQYSSSLSPDLLSAVFNHVDCVLPNAQTPRCHVVHSAKEVILKPVGEERTASRVKRVQLFTFRSLYQLT